MPEDGAPRIELRGELAGILALAAADSKKPDGRSTAELAAQIKMVAGACNQRYLQALRTRIPMVSRLLNMATDMI